MAIYKLKDLIQEVISGEWGEEVSDNSTGIKVIRTTNFSNVGKLNLDKEIVLRKIESDKIAKKHLIVGDTIIEKSGGSPDQPVGRVVFFEEDEMYLCNNFTSILRPNKNLVEPKYLLYLLFNLYRQRKVLKFQNKTTGIINLKLDQYLNQTKVDIPSKEIQLKVVNALDKAFHLIEKRQSQIAALDELTQSVFLEMFGDPSTNPKGWCKATLPQIVEDTKYSIKRGPFGGALKKDNFINQGYLVYEQYHAINDDFSLKRYFIDDEKFEELKAFKVNPGDLIVSCSGVTLGRIAEIPQNSLPGIINQALLKITLDSRKMNNVFFKFLFRNRYVQNILFSVSRGSGVPNLPPMSVIKSIEFMCPPIDLQKAFEIKINAIQAQKSNLEFTLKEMRNLYNSLLQKAFKGELF